jgi:hypothetical protein
MRPVWGREEAEAPFPSGLGEGGVQKSPDWVVGKDLLTQSAESGGEIS